MDPPFLQRILKGEAIQDSRQHPHVVGGRPIHPGSGSRQAAEDIATPDHDGDLDPQGMDSFNLSCDEADHLGLDSEFEISPECFTAHLEDNPRVRRFHLYVYPSKVQRPKSSSDRDN